MLDGEEKLGLRSEVDLGGGGGKGEGEGESDLGLLGELLGEVGEELKEVRKGGGGGKERGSGSRQSFEGEGGTKY